MTKNINQEQLEKILKDSSIPIFLGISLYKKKEVSFFDLVQVIFENGYSNIEFEAFLRKECVGKSPVQVLFHDIKTKIVEKFSNQGLKPLPFSQDDHSWTNKLAFVYEEVMNSNNINLPFFKEVLSSHSFSTSPVSLFWARLHLIPEKNRLPIFSILLKEATPFTHPLVGVDVYNNYYLESSSDISDNGKTKEQFIKTLPLELLDTIDGSLLKKMIAKLTDKFNHSQYCGDLKSTITGVLNQKLALVEAVKLKKDQGKSLPQFTQIKL